MTSVVAKKPTALEKIKSIVQPNTAVGTRSKAAHFYFLSIEDPDAFCLFLSRLHASGRFNTVGSEVRDASCVAAFSYRGLRKIGLPEYLISPLGKALKEGMASRSDLLGDRGKNSPSYWSVPLGSPEIDLMLAVWLHERDTDPAIIFEEHTANADNSFRQAGCRLLKTESALRNEVDGVIENVFGFKEGVSQPSSKTDPETGKTLCDDVRAARLKPFFLSTDPDADAASKGSWQQVLGLAERLPGDEKQRVRELAGAMISGSTFLVYRKIRTHADRFEKWCEEVANQTGVDAGRVAELVFGRRKNGDPLAPGAAKSATDNNFDYSDDPDGVHCPLGSHIRRVNPRSGTDPETHQKLQRRFDGEGHTKGKHIFGRRSMIRRGITFDDKKGMHFLAFVGDIESQFEFIQREWINRGDFTGQGARFRDPIASTRGDETEFDFGLSEKKLGRKKIKPVTELSGGEYLFVPGLKFLELLASGISSLSAIAQAPPAEPDQAQEAPLQSRSIKFKQIGDVILGGEPVFEANGDYFIARYDDVKGMVDNAQDYSSAHYLRRIEKLTNEQPFALGMPVGSAHTDQRQQIEGILGNGVMDELWSKPILHPAEDGRSTDLLFEFIWRRLVRYVELQFGVTVPGTAGESALSDTFGNVAEGRHVAVYPEDRWQELYRWKDPGDIKAHNLQAVVRRAGAYIIGVSESEAVLRRAKTSSREFFGWPGRKKIADDAIRLGLTVASCGTIAKAAGNIFDFLLGNPAAVQDVRDAIVKQQKSGKNELRPIILEILRLNPVLPVLRRDTVRAKTLGETTIPAQSTVLGLAGPALRDPAKFENPNEFQPGRVNFDGSLVFGSGPHRCLGEDVSLEFLSRAVFEVLDRFDIYRAAGRLAGPIYTVPISTDPLSMFARLVPRSGNGY